MAIEGAEEQSGANAPALAMAIVRAEERSGANTPALAMAIVGAEERSGAIAPVCIVPMAPGATTIVTVSAEGPSVSMPCVVEERQ